MTARGTILTNDPASFPVYPDDLFCTWTIAKAEQDVTALSNTIGVEFTLGGGPADADVREWLDLEDDNELASDSLTVSIQSRGANALPFTWKIITTSSHGKDCPSECERELNQDSSPTVHSNEHRELTVSVQSGCTCSLKISLPECEKLKRGNFSIFDTVTVQFATDLSVGRGGARLSYAPYLDPCPGGTHAFKDKATSVRRCEVCANGLYNDDGYSFQCKKCPKGRFTTESTFSDVHDWERASKRFDELTWWTDGNGLLSETQLLQIVGEQYPYKDLPTIVPASWKTGVDGYSTGAGWDKTALQRVLQLAEGTSKRTCTPCPAGTFALRLGSTGCVADFEPVTENADGTERCLTSVPHLNRPNSVSRIRYGLVPLKTELPLCAQRNSSASC